MIAARSASYPITGAALAAGVDPGIASRWVWAIRLYDAGGDMGPVREAYEQGVARHGPRPMARLRALLADAVNEGRLYLPERQA